MIGFWKMNSLKLAGKIDIKSWILLSIIVPVYNVNLYIDCFFILCCDLIDCEIILFNLKQ